MKRYFFVLGSNFNLSLAELSALFPHNRWEKCDSVVLSDFSEELDCRELMVLLGGTIKIGEVVKEISLANRRSLAESVKRELILEAKKSGTGELSGKFNFGFSFYNKKNLAGDFFKLGLAVKKDLKNMGLASRMVMSREPILSSVVVEQNKLVKNGLELCFMVDKKTVYLGKTLVVQPFKDLSKRDFGRPNRDDHSGMIPPKLAQIMINLARRNDKDYQDKILADPFCGSGTILMEAYLMGFKNIIGTDLSDKAVVDSKKNMEWLFDLKNNSGKGNNINIFKSDILELDKKIDKNSVDYVVCEPYLGPQRGFKDFTEVVSDLDDLYSKSFEILFDILKIGGRIVMVWPQFRAENKVWKINPKIGRFKFRATLDLNIEDKKELNKDRNTLVYGRAEQKVWREIVILEKLK